MSDLRTMFGDATTANVSDVLGSLGVMHPDIKPAVPGFQMVGRAFTVKAYPGSIITVHKALVEASPGDLIVVDGEGDVGSGALLGEIMALECRTKGFAGILIDGAVRDVDGLRELGFPVFARGLTPRVGTNRRLGRTQVPVSCGGIVVFPGDIIIGDDNGVVAVPRDEEDGLEAALVALLAKEEKVMEDIRQGTFLADRPEIRDSLKA